MPASETQYYDAIVIGSGLGGLTAGALFARAGRRVLLLERNASFGGAASTYRHGALTVEASLHETTHPDGPTDPKREIFEALDLEADVNFTPVGAFQEVRAPFLGAPLALPHGFDEIETRLSERFPDEAKNISRFLRQIRRTLGAVSYIDGDHGPLWRLAHAADLPLGLWSVIRDARSSLSDVLARHFGDNEAVKIALCANLGYYTDDPDRLWWLAYAMAQGGYLSEGGYYIRGGSQKLSSRLAEIILEEGGETLARAEAVGVELDKDGAVAGVRYRTRLNEDDEGVETFAAAPVVFANAAPHVIEELLPADAREAFAEPYKNRETSISLFSATLGLNKPPATFGVSSYSTVLIPPWVKSLGDYRDSAALLGDAPSATDGARMPIMIVVDYARIDSGVADAAPYPLSITCTDNYDNWRNLDDKTAHERKEAWVDAFIARLDAEWPGIADAVVDRTAVSARNMRDYLNTPNGAVYGFAMTPPEELPKGPPLNVKTPIEGLFLASSFAGFGGFTGAMGGGAGAARAGLAHRRK